MTQATTMLAQMPMWGDGGHVMGLHWGWWTFWLVVTALVVWGLARGLGGAARQKSGSASEVSAEEMLRRRLAAGEIDEEEYGRRLEALRGDDQG